MASPSRGTGRRSRQARTMRSRGVLGARRPSGGGERPGGSWSRRQVSLLTTWLVLGATLVMGQFGLASPASAADTPWSCDAYGYLFQTPSPASHLIQQVDLATGDFSTYDTTADQLNAVGYNTLDDYMYGWDTTTRTLVRISSDGTLFNLGVPIGMGATAVTNGFVVGDFDDAGHLWVMNNSTGRWFEIDLAPGSPTYGAVLSNGTVTFPSTLSSQIADWTFINGFFYGVAPGLGGNQKLVRFNPATGGMVDLGILTVPAGSGLFGFPTGTSNFWGATYADAAGNLYAQNNGTGQIYRIDVTTVTGFRVSTGPLSSSNDGARCALAPIPTLTVTKTVNGRAQASDQFTVGLEDSGGTTLDAATTTGTGTTASTLDFPVSQGDTYTITDAMDAGSASTLGAYLTAITCTNTSTGQTVTTGGTSPNWTMTVADAADYVCNVTNTAANPAIDLVKTVDKTTLVAGQTLNYTFTATNTGDTSLSNVSIAETSFTGSGSMSALTCVPPQPATLAPGAVMTCTATYVVTQADVDAGSVDNTATATGTPPSGPNVTDTDDATVPATQTPAIDLVKTVDKTTLVAGQTLNYTFTATNTGNVTLTNVVIAETSFTGSGSMSALTCVPPQPATLAPGAVLTCTATYVVTQADVDAGSVDNTATATGTPPTGPDVTDTDDAQVPATQTAAYTLDKTAAVTDVDGDGLTDVGDEIDYSFVVTNTGNTTLTGVSISDPLLASVGITITCNPTTLAPGASVTCTADAPYVITQGDVDAGAVVNTATADATPPAGVTDPPQPTDSTVTPTDQASSISLVKTADQTQLVVGQTITYTFTATNTGNTTLTDVVIAETAFTGTGTPPVIGNCTPTAPAVLVPGAVLTCTANYVVTQADLDAGRLDNSATATGTDPSGNPVTATASRRILGFAAPAVTIDKTASVVDVNGNGLTDVGDEIDYSFVVTNTGNVTLTNVTVNDTLLASVGITITCAPTTLAPAAVATCTADAPYVITQADVDAGAVQNTATATGDDPTGTPVTSPPDMTITPTDQAAAIDLVKTVDKTTLVAGQTLNYTFTATNTGNVTLTNVVIAETSFTGSGSMSALTCVPPQPATLAPGAVLTCTAAYVVTQADVDAGSVDNTATATGTPPTGPDVTDTDDATVPATQAPAVTIDKTASVVDVNGNGLTDVGDEIDYSFVVTNTGNVTLTNVTVNDTLLASVGITITCAPTTLAPAAVATCTADAPYVITQADVDAGAVQNTATATGDDPTGTPVTSPPDMTITPTDQAAAIDLVKTVDKTTLVAGQTLNYTFTATNTGNVTLTNVVIAETSFTGSGSMSALTCVPPQPATLAPGAVLTCTAAYVVTQADVDAGSVDNTATATGTPPTGPDVTDTDDATVPATQAPAVTIDKTASVVDVNGNGLTDVGDEIDYSFVVTNTGNVTLTNVTVNDTLLASVGITITCAPTTLAPAAVATCTADAPYVITQADVDAGAVQNTATATGDDPTGTPVTSPPDMTITPTDQAAAIDLVKTVDKTTLVAGQTLNYTFTATNTGNVTLTNVVIAETSFTGSGSMSALTCVPPQPATLAPGAVLTCTAAYVVTQADVDAGSVDNTATATGTPPTGPDVTDTDDATVPATQAPAVTIDKTASVVDVNGNGLTDVGDEIDYSFVVTNTGNVTLTNVTVNDTLLASVGITITCAPTTLAPAAVATCTADAPYVITQADVDAGAVQNTATATGDDPTGTPVTSPLDMTITPTDQAAAIDLVKTVDKTTLVAGQTLNYTFTATNTGNVTLTNVVIAETSFTGSGSMSALTCVPPQPATLAPGAVLTCTAAYVVTQADVDAGSVDNTATATGTPPGSGRDRHRRRHGARHPDPGDRSGQDRGQDDAGGGADVELHVHGDQHRERDADQRGDRGDQLHRVRVDVGADLCPAPAGDPGSGCGADVYRGLCGDPGRCGRRFGGQHRDRDRYPTHGSGRDRHRQRPGARYLRTVRSPWTSGWFR